MLFPIRLLWLEEYCRHGSQVETVNRFIYLNELYRCVCQTFKIWVFFNTIPEERLKTTRKRTRKETVNRRQSGATEALRRQRSKIKKLGRRSSWLYVSADTMSHNDDDINTIEESIYQENVLIGWKYLLFPGYFAYIDDAYKAQLKSPLLPWKPFHRTVGLCLRFKYLMKTHSKSSLRIFLKEAKQEKPVLAWQLSGYHGEDWSLAQVVWSGADTTQVGESADTFNFNLPFLLQKGQNRSRLERLLVPTRPVSYLFWHVNGFQLSGLEKRPRFW